MKVKLLKKLRRIFPLETRGGVIFRTYKRSWQDNHFYKTMDWSPDKKGVIECRRRNILIYLRNNYTPFLD